MSASPLPPRRSLPVNTTYQTAPPQQEGGDGSGKGEGPGSGVAGGRASAALTPAAARRGAGGVGSPHARSTGLAMAVGSPRDNFYDDQADGWGGERGGSALLPSIGIVEKKANTVSSPEAMGSPSTTPHNGKSRRRSNYIRRASVDEIKYFTDLLRKGMTMERPYAMAFDDEKVMRAESLAMSMVEKEQCKVDRFWGFEYEKKQQGENMELMFKEDIRSRYHQDELQLADKWEVWSGYDLTRKKEEARHRAWLEQKRRRSYLRDFYSLESSENILHYHWPAGGDSDATMRHPSSPLPPPETPTERHLKPRGYTLDTVKLNSQRVLGTFHVNRKRHQLIHSSTIKGEDPLHAGGKRSATSTVSSGTNHLSEGLHLHRAPLPLADTSYSYGLDEQSVLKALFDSVDTRQCGVIRRDQFVKAVRFDQRTRAWLQKTFLWSLYKARKWSMLLDMFNHENSRDSVGLVTFVDFYHFIQKCQLEKGVPCHRIRWPQHGCRASYLLHSRLNRPLPQSEPVGRQVDFLFQGGPIWQPGRIVKVNDDGTYDIRCDLYDGDVLLKIETPPEEMLGVAASISNQHEDREGETEGSRKEGQARDENDVLDYFFDSVHASMAAAGVGGDDTNRPEAGEASPLPSLSAPSMDLEAPILTPEALLQAVGDPRYERCHLPCKTLTALRDFPVVGEALKYIASDDRMPGVSRQEFHVFCDAIADLLAINDLLVAPSPSPTTA